MSQGAIDDLLREGFVDHDGVPMAPGGRRSRAIRAPRRGPACVSGIGPRAPDAARASRSAFQSSVSRHQSSNMSSTQMVVPRLLAPSRWRASIFSTRRCRGSRGGSTSGEPAPRAHSLRGLRETSRPGARRSPLRRVRGSPGQRVRQRIFQQALKGANQASGDRRDRRDMLGE